MSWAWYAGGICGSYSIGPFATREEVVTHAIDNRLGERAGGLTFWVIEGLHKPLELADAIDADEIIGLIAEGAWAEQSDPDGDVSLFDAVSENAIADLQHRLREAAAAWQKHHGVVITPWAFTDVRNGARVEFGDGLGLGVVVKPEHADAPASEGG